MYVSPELSIVGVSLIPIVGGMAIVYGRVVKKMTQQMNDSLAAATQIADERISGIRTVRAFAAEATEARVYSQRIDTVLDVGNEQAKARASFLAAVRVH